MFTTHPVLGDLIDTWQRELSRWINAGQLARAIADGFDLPSEQAQACAASLQTSAAPARLKIEVLDDQSLSGLLGAYAASTRTAYLNEKLAQEPSLVALVLTHELGHHIETELLQRRSSHVAIQAFVEQLLPGAMDQATAASTLIRQQMPAASITLPDGRQLAVEAFGTDLHKQFDKASLPFISSQAEAILARAQDDTDNLNKFNELSLQYYSFAHFDNNNISGSLAAIRRWYEDGLESFLTGGTIADRNKGDSSLGLVNPEFTGPNAGIDLMLYRFGQIAHAFQDFYSHSNWYQIVASGYLPEASILAGGVQELPTVAQPGSYLPGSSVMIAQSGPDWSKIMHKSGTGNYSGLKRSVYWEVDSDGSPSDKRPFPLGSRFGLVGARTLGGNPIIGLATGAVNGFAYPDPDLSVLLRDPAKTGQFEREYFRGLDHGGLAGTLTGQWISPINKDTAKSVSGQGFLGLGSNVPGYSEAVAFARLQLQNEWDRLGNLIFKKYGREGLIRFADVAISQGQREAYINSYDNKPGGRWNWAEQNTVQAFSLEPDVQSVEPQSDPSEPELSITSSIPTTPMLPDIRFARIFKADPENPQQVEDFDLVQFKSADGQWLDSAAEDFDYHHELSEDDLALLQTARPVQHVDSGGRAYWRQARPEDVSGNARIHFLENVNTDVALTIENFNIFQDRIAIVEADGSERMLPTRFSTYLGYQSLKTLLLQEFNVTIDARPTRQAVDDSWVLGAQDVARADGTTAGLTLRAGQVFDDPDEGAKGAQLIEPNLSFADYDDSLPFLKLIDGQLVALPNLQEYAGATYKAMVWDSDDRSNLTEQILEIAVAPKITFANPSIGSFDANQRFQMDLLLESETAYSVTVEFSDQNPTTPDFFELSGSQIGLASGVPIGFQASDLTITLGTGISSGTPSFWFHPVNSDQWSELQILPTGERGFTLVRDNTLVASMQPVEQPGSPEIRFDDYFINDESYSATGFTFTPDSESQLNFRLMGEAANSAVVGLYMTDVVTGAIVDPLSGDLVNIDETNIGTAIDDLSLFWQPVPSATVSDFSIKTSHHALIDYANIIWTPVIKTSGSGGSETFFTVNDFNRDGLEHAIIIGNQVLGFEDILGGGDHDFDDVILMLLPASMA